MLNRRRLLAGIVAVVAAPTAGYLNTNAHADATDLVEVQWKQYHGKQNISISLWVIPKEKPRYRYIVGATSIHFNAYNEETLNLAITEVLRQFRYSFPKEPWFREAYAEATNNSTIDFYLE